jgi:hypothetical protein
MRIVLTSVGYADFLAVTIAAWKRVVPAGCLTLATSPDDVDSQRLAAAHRLSFIATDAWSNTDSSCHVGARPGFNMALGLDVSLGLIRACLPPPEEGEICGHVNADCYPTGDWPAEDTFAPETVYGFWRYECQTPTDLDAYLKGLKDKAAYSRIKTAKGAPTGYCQIFRWRPGLRFGSYPSAGAFDTDFTKRFSQKVMRDEVFLLHLGGRDRANWAGRTLPVWGVA